MSDFYCEDERHVCCECMATIDAGERYVAVAAGWEGTAESWKKCLFCAELSRMAWDLCEHDEDSAAQHGGLCAWLNEWFWRDDSYTSQILAGLFPLVEMASLEHEALHYASRAVSMRHGSRMRGHYIGRRVAAQSRLRAIRAQRWTVTA